MQPFILATFSLCLLTSCTAVTVNTPQSPTTPLTTKSTTTPTVDERQTLLDAYREEMLAHDIYSKIVAKYPTLTELNNIINSENTHREQVGALLDARGIDRPTDYGVYTETEATLTKKLNESLTGAIEVGVMVETGDIDHLLAEYKKVESPDVRMTFENIGGGSFNHLRAFLRLARANNYTVTTDYSRYMTPSDLDTTGPLHIKMTELLRANGLPTYNTNPRHGSSGMRHGGNNGSGFGRNH